MNNLTLPRGKYQLPLGIQLMLPFDYLSNSEFKEDLAILRANSFDCIELNIANPDEINPTTLISFLAEFGLKMTMFATGYSAKLNGLNLSTNNEEVRSLSIKKCLSFIDFAEKMNCGLILGLIQGGPTADICEARNRFVESLHILIPYAQKKSVLILVEATNKQLTSIANSIEQTKELTSIFPHKTVRILADTYHMSFEESDILHALQQGVESFYSIHLSDNNRYYPGYGSLNFKDILECLLTNGFFGPVVLEANRKNSFKTDINNTVRYLISCGL